MPSAWPVPKPLFEARYEIGSYDVTPDGQRFLLLKAGDDKTTAGQLQLVVDWFEELKRRVPVGKK